MNTELIDINRHFRHCQLGTTVQGSVRRFSLIHPGLLVSIWGWKYEAVEVADVQQPQKGWSEIDVESIAVIQQFSFKWTAI